MADIGIDNGVSGSIGVIDGGQEYFYKVPTRAEQDYTKKKKNLRRVDVAGLKSLLRPHLRDGNNHHVMMERPMVNPGRFNATTSALRAMEATLIALEQLCLPVHYVDSKEWQNVLLPRGCKGNELKKASVAIGCRYFPSLAADFRKHKDADGMLIAEYCRRFYQ